MTSVPAAGRRRRSARLRPVALAAAMVLILAGCGGSSGTKAADPNDLAVAVASYDLASGAPTRFIVGLLTVDQRLIGYGSVDLRFSYVGAKSGSASSPPGPVVKASYLPIYGSTIPSPPPVDPQIVLESDSRGVYGAQTTFDKAGFWEVEASATIAGKVRTGKGAFQVNATHDIPAPGDQAIPTDSLTLTTPDVPKAAVDSRAGSGGDVPDPDLHRTSIAAALAAHHPIVAVFATPVYCTSRFCGPITDMVNDLAHKYPDRADFIHVEIWRDFQGQVVNKAAADWLYRNNDLNEPWVFVIGADGKITARFDNVVTLDELEPLVQALPPMAAAAR